MKIFPAIDLYEGKAVRLLRGRYEDMTIYSDDPPSIGRDFAAAGAEQIHIVDLEGAKDGTTPNFETVCRIKEASGCFCEIGGGIRSATVIEKYMEAGIDRVILGTAAVTDRAFLEEAVGRWGEKIAVGIDLKTGQLSEFGICKKGGAKRTPCHPDSQVRFAEVRIPFVQEAVNLAEILHEKLSSIRVIGWDIAITPDGPVFSEGNDNPEISGLQTVNGGLKRRVLDYLG